MSNISEVEGTTSLINYNSHYSNKGGLQQQQLAEQKRKRLSKTYKSQLLSIVREEASVSTSKNTTTKAIYTLTKVVASARNPLRSRQRELPLLVTVKATTDPMKTRGLVPRRKNPKLDKSISLKLKKRRKDLFYLSNS